MKTESDKTNFDLSLLSLDELIKLYEDITEFSRFLNDKSIDTEKDGGKDGK